MKHGDYFLVKYDINFTTGLVYQFDSVCNKQNYWIKTTCGVVFRKDSILVSGSLHKIMKYVDKHAEMVSQIDVLKSKIESLKNNFLKEIEDGC